MMRCCEDLRIFSLENLFSDTTLSTKFFSLINDVVGGTRSSMCVLIDNFEDVNETKVFVHQYNKSTEKPLSATYIGRPCCY